MMVAKHSNSVAATCALLLLFNAAEYSKGIVGKFSSKHSDKFNHFQPFSKMPFKDSLETPHMAFAFKKLVLCEAPTAKCSSSPWTSARTWGNCSTSTLLASICSCLLATWLDRPKATEELSKRSCLNPWLINFSPFAKTSCPLSIAPPRLLGCTRSLPGGTTWRDARPCFSQSWFSSTIFRFTGSSEPMIAAASAFTGSLKAMACGCETQSKIVAVYMWCCDVFPVLLTSGNIKLTPSYVSFLWTKKM